MKSVAVVCAVILTAAAAAAQNNPPRPSENTSEPRWTTESPNPPMPQQLAPTVKQVPPAPQVPAAPAAPQPPTSATAKTAAPAPAPSLAREESGYTIAGSRIYTAAEVADWKASLRRVGTVVNAPPAGFDVVKGTFGTLAYAKGVFYQQQGANWVVVPAPAGAKVKDRPAAASLLLVQDVPYWYYNGAFFVWNDQAATVEIAKAPVGAVVTSIPDTSLKQERNGETFFVYGGTTFRQTKRGSVTVYVVTRG